MAKIIGPVQSFEARGKLGATVFGMWRGIQWARQHFIPANPQTANQVNIRTALTLMVAEWQSQTSTEQDLWSDAAKGKPLSGYNLFMQAGLDEYISQLGISTTPASVVYTGPYPGAFVWA